MNIQEETKKASVYINIQFETQGSTQTITSYCGSPVDPLDLFSKASSTAISEESEEELQRENWSGRLDFLLSCIGFAVGLGNIWRFPYLCYKSGGGAFLIPYTFFLTTCGLPLFMLEISYGQFASLSPITVWRISPLFRGIGYGMVIISALVCIYYNVILAWNFYFLFMSFSKVLPWSLCDQSWNTPDCVIMHETNNVTAMSQVKTAQHASTQFWERKVLDRTDGIEDLGSIRWSLFFYLLLAWIIVFMCLSKGVKSSGKVVYVTATFPYIVMVILLIRGITLPGAMTGVRFYVVPKWSKLMDLSVWGDAAVQIFYSVGVAWGSLITMASYNKFDHNVHKDAIIVPIVNCATSVFAGFAIFSTLGFMSHTSGVPIDKVVAQGPGLTFVAYPEAVAHMPLSQLWAVLFFLMIFTVGVDSQFTMFETVTSAFIDEYPHFLRRKKFWFTAIMCLVEFCLGIPLITQGGIYLLEIIDWYCATFSLMVLSLVECLVLSWIYGVDRFARDIQLMTGRRPLLPYLFMWKYCTPVVIIFIWSFSVGTLEPVSLGSYKFPKWAIYFGWALGSMSLIPLPIEAVNGIRRETSGTIWQRIKKLSRPAYNWGPALDEDLIRYVQSMTPEEYSRYEEMMIESDMEDMILPYTDDGSEIEHVTMPKNIKTSDMEHVVIPSNTKASDSKQETINTQQN